MKKVTGPCQAYFKRFFYNAATGKCEEFIYGGCKGNQNNFMNELECEARCVYGKYLEKVPLWMFLNLDDSLFKKNVLLHIQPQIVESDYNLRKYLCFCDKDKLWYLRFKMVEIFIWNLKLFVTQ